MNSSILRREWIPALQAVTLLWLNAAAAVPSVGQENDVTGSSGRSATNNVVRATPSPRDTIFFRNGDILYGTLLGIEPKAGIRWRHPDVVEPIEFAPSSVEAIEFGFRERPPFQNRHACQIRLVNEDEILGNLLRCDAETIVLESWYAGRITLPRSMVQLITPKPDEPPAIYEGPSSPEGWTFGKVRGGIPNAGEWSYRNGAFYATKSASVARDVDLPDVARIQFDLAWKGMLYMAVALYTDYMEPVSLQSKESEPKFGGFYSLQLSSYTVNLIPVTQHDPLRYLGQTSVPTFSQKNKSHIDVRVNKAKRATTLLVDGVIVKQWIDTEGFIGQGTGLRFVHQGQGAVKLNNLRVSRWDGQFEEKVSNRPNRPRDLVTLRNGNKISGTVNVIQDGKLDIVASDGTRLDVAFAEIKLLELATKGIARSNGSPTDVKATFRNGGVINLKLEEWTPDKMVGTTPSFGRIVFHPSAFIRIDTGFDPVEKGLP